MPRTACTSPYDLVKFSTSRMFCIRPPLCAAHTVFSAVQKPRRFLRPPQDYDRLSWPPHKVLFSTLYHNFYAAGNGFSAPPQQTRRTGCNKIVKRRKHRFWSRVLQLDFTAIRATSSVVSTTDYSLPFMAMRTSPPYLFIAPARKIFWN